MSIGRYITRANITKKDHMLPSKKSKSTHTHTHTCYNLPLSDNQTSIENPSNQTHPILPPPPNRCHPHFSSPRPLPPPAALFGSSTPHHAGRRGIRRRSPPVPTKCSLLHMIRQVEIPSHNFQWLLLTTRRKFLPIFCGGVCHILGARPYSGF